LKLAFHFTYPFGSNWQGRRDSNPQPADLESDALPLELLPYMSKTLFAFAMNSVLTAELAEFFEFELVRSLLFIFGGRIIFSFELGAI
jgi:hypothetical protein